MHRRLFTVLLLLAPLAAVAQSPAAAPAPAGGFDFLLGDWSVEVQVKVSGLAAWIHGAPKLVGTLKARRTAEGIEDELAIVDASGNPRGSNRTLRRFDAAAGRWSISNADAYHAREGRAQAWQDGSEMRVEGSYTEDGKTTLTRSRYYAIGADRFRFRQDRSYDQGASWDENVFAFDATRTAAAPP